MSFLRMTHNHHKCSLVPWGGRTASCHFPLTSKGYWSSRPVEDESQLVLAGGVFTQWIVFARGERANCLIADHMY